MSRVPRWCSVLAGVLAATVTGSATAQASGSVALLSDYRFRGVSFTAGHPAAQVDVSYDTSSGAYLGAFASNARFEGYRGLNRVLLGYAGYAQRLGPDFSIDAGLTYADFAAGSDFDYGEVHTGVTLRALNVQVAYAPRYLGQGAATYVELNGGTELCPSVRLLGHAGWLRARLTMDASATITQADGRAGLRYDHRLFSVQVSRVVVSRVTAIYPGGPSSDRSGWVVQVMRVF